jgi:hypothetical protein
MGFKEGGANGVCRMKSLARRIIESAVSVARAYDALPPDSHEKREIVMQHGEKAIAALLCEHQEECLCQGEH